MAEHCWLQICPVVGRGKGWFLHAAPQLACMLRPALQPVKQALNIRGAGLCLRKDAHWRLQAEGPGSLHVIFEATGTAADKTASVSVARRSIGQRTLWPAGECRI